MKKVLVFLILILCMFSLAKVVYAAPICRWDNPKAIKTYIEPNEKKELMKKAFAKWSQATNDKVVFVYISDPFNADITVKFVKDVSKDIKMERAIGAAIPQFLGHRLVIVDILIANNAPNGAMFRKDAVYQIMLHEIGHALGLFEHSKDPKSIMYPAKVSRYQDITPEDLANLAELYSW